MLSGTAGAVVRTLEDVTQPKVPVDRLWEWALDDAGPAAGDVVLVEAESWDNRKFRGRFMPPGERDVPLPEGDLQAVNAQADRMRVVLPTAHLADDPVILLALMRHHLEYARVFNSRRGVYGLTLDVASALYAPYAQAGQGSAVVYNAIPMMQSANAAGARAVARRLGPQFDRPHDPDVTYLLRTDAPPVALEDLARQTTVFAAIWPDALRGELSDRGADLDSTLGEAHEAAPEWWEMVRQDETFRALALGASAFRPTPDEREAFSDEPAIAWRTAQALIARARRYGIALVRTGSAASAGAGALG